MQSYLLLISYVASLSFSSITKGFEESSSLSLLSSLKELPDGFFTSMSSFFLFINGYVFFSDSSLIKVEISSTVK